MRMALHKDTLAVTSGRPSAPGDPLNAPLVPASTYRAGGPLGYGRDGNPGWAAFEAAVSALEGGSATAFSSGLAAAASVVALVPEGGVVVAPATQYHGVASQLNQLADRRRIELRAVDLTDHGTVAGAVADAALIWVESPSNPMLDIVDLAWIARCARASGAMLAVDSTLATPLLQQPLSLGADVVIHSATKFIGGHSDSLLGVVSTSRADLQGSIAAFRHEQGAVPGTLEVFLSLRGLRTLSVRMERAQVTAAILAERLQGHRAVARVRYPGLADHPQHALAGRQMSGFGAMVSFETRGSAREAERMCESLQLLVHATSLGGVETLIERRARYAGDREQGVPSTLLRMSVGLEHAEDLWHDLDHALNGIDT